MHFFEKMHIFKNKNAYFFSRVDEALNKILFGMFGNSFFTLKSTAFYAKHDKISTKNTAHFK